MSLRLGIAVIWVLLPAILVALAIREWLRRGDLKARARFMSMAVVVGIVVDWVCFLILLALGLIGGFGSHIVTTRLANWFVVGSVILLALAVVTKVARGKLTLATLLVLALWMGSEVVA